MDDVAGPILIVSAVLLVVVTAIPMLYALGVRAKSSIVRNAARHFHRAIGNPVQLRTAGGPHAFASVIRHQGRITGKTYETPVWAMPTEDGFAIAIVYGSGTDWVENVMESERAAIVHGGRTYVVDQPEIVPMEDSRRYFPTALQLTHRGIRVEHCLRVRRVDLAETSAVSRIEGVTDHDRADRG